VLEAGDGQAALDLVRRQEGRLDLVVTDIGMAGMDGYQLAARLRAERPALPVVFMTGYGDGRSGERASAGDGPVLQKPFAPEDLLRLVGEALAAPQVS
jgi:CheY-like chemotaxis protein